MTKVAKAIATCGVVAGLGIAGIPLGLYAAKDATLTVSATINDYVAVDAEDNVVQVSQGVINNGDPQYAGTDLNIKTNTKDYYVQISATDTRMTNDRGDYIAAGKPEQGESAWGYKASAEEGSGFEITSDEFQGVETTPTTIATKNGTPTQDGDTLHIDFGVSTNGAQAEGDYHGEVTITATPGIQKQ